MTNRADTATAMLLRQSRRLRETLRRTCAAHAETEARAAALVAERRALLGRSVPGGGEDRRRVPA